MSYFQFNEEHGVLVDEQGIMHSKATVFALAKECLAHLKHSDLELKALGRQFVEENHPKMVAQFNFDLYP